jgi:two-component system, NarL family, nitrate/nitrite response regulator NarL
VALLLSIGDGVLTRLKRSGRTGTVGPTEMKRVFIVSEVRLYREGLARLLRGDQRLEVVGDAADVPGALEQLDRLDAPPEAVLLDVPAPAGLDGLAQLRDAVPSARIIVLNVSDRDGRALIAWAEAGVGGLLARDVDLDDIAQAVQTTVSGGTVCSPRLAALLLQRLARSPEQRPVTSPLTSREREIAALLEEGMSNKEIAARLRIELATVKNHVHSILTKLNASRRGQAAAMLRDEH